MSALSPDETGILKPGPKGEEFPVVTDPQLAAVSRITRAVAEVPCPVLANGNIYSSQKACEVLKITGARGLMIGRGAIRNP